MVVVSNTATRVLLRTASGLVVRGADFASVAEHAAPQGSVVRGALSLSELLGPARHLAVGGQELRAAVRRHFAWEEWIQRLARTLADLRGAGPHSAPRMGLTTAALADSWPVAIENLPALAGYLESVRRTPVAVSEQGLLALLVDALAEPWNEAAEPISLPLAAYARFARCAMLASEVLDAREPRDGAITLFAPDALLGLGRIREFDWPQCALVRAHELYVELLPRFFPEADRLFEKARGISVAEWIHGAVALAVMAFENIKPGGSFGVRIDFRQPDTRRAADRVRRVAEQLSRSREEFGQVFAPLLARGTNPGLAFRPLRESPLLRLEPGLYIGLHADFLLAAADEKVFFSMRDEMPNPKGALLTAAGDAFEEYVWRVLSRCSAAWNDPVARVPEAPGRKRCDFAWRVGEDLLLLDAKRFGLPADMLMGDLALSERMTEDIGHALQQFAETAEDIRQHGMVAVVPELAGWTPRRVFAAAVSHRPMYAWFGATEQIAARTELPRPWNEVFSARALVWSISDLELLEASLPSRPLQGMLDDLSTDHPRTYLDVRAYLEDVGWKGPAASQYFATRAREILNEAPDGSLTLADRGL